MHNSIAILDFGSQYAQLIARRVREAHVYCELFPWDAPAGQVLAINPQGFILSGGPMSVYAEGAPTLLPYVLASKLPVLGLCYGMQLLTYSLGGEVAHASEREYGPAEIQPLIPGTMLDAISKVWMSHGDRITRMPAGFVALASSGNSPIAAMGDFERKYFAVQFHPEVKHTPNGAELLRHFVIDICGCAPDWTPASIIEDSLARDPQAGGKRARAGGGQRRGGFVGGGRAGAAGHRRPAGGRLRGYRPAAQRRAGTGGAALSASQMGAELVAVDAAEEFFTALKGVTDPEQKRKIVGEKFIRIFEREAGKLGQPHFLVQGTIYPDVVELAAPDRNKAARIKSHHNVGGLPEDMEMSLVEPLRYLFKDEVRAVGEALGLPEAMVWRQPFPGPGLTVRCLGEVTPARVACLRAADAILLEELSAAGLMGKGAETSQAFVVLLPVRSVGVMGDERTYQEAAAIRAVVTDDFMTADWVRLPYEVLAKVANRIVNEVHGINRVVYDITSKPPATIEWE